MVWTLKSKTLQQEANVEIQTPDGQQILVGSIPDEVLLYSEGFNNWSIKEKS